MSGVSIIPDDTGVPLVYPTARATSCARNGGFTSEPIGGITVQDHYVDQGEVLNVSMFVEAADVRKVFEDLEDLRGRTTVSVSRPGLPLVTSVGLASWDDQQGIADGVDVSMTFEPLRFGTTKNTTRQVRPTAATEAGLADEVDKGNKPARDQSILDAALTQLGLL